MKKIALLAVAVIATATAGAQMVVGLQGGYFNQQFSNPQFRTDVPRYGSTTGLTQTNTTWLGGLEVGYQIGRKWYVGITGQYISYFADENLVNDSLYIGIGHHSQFRGMTLPVRNHYFQHTRTGWEAALVAKYEIVRYGNMRFNMMLQAGYNTLGYTTTVEQYTKSYAFYDPYNNIDERNEREDFDAVTDGLRSTTLSVSLRPTLVYEFSEHLSAELSLDFLSVGWMRHTDYVDDFEYIYEPNPLDPTNPMLLDLIEPHEIVTETLYAGLNTLKQTLSWENPMLRLGFNWKF